MRWAVVACCLVLDALILGLALFARTTEPLVSPWDVFPNWLVLVFGASSALLAYSLTISLPKTIRFLSLALHGAAAWWVAALVYELGFGFDPLIHQAAEQHLASQGSITLKTPLYIGQYAFVWLAHTMTRIPVILIDQWLVPILSLTLLPLLYKTHRYLPLALFLLPASWFTFTIPFHLGLLLFIAAIALTHTKVTTSGRIALIACAPGSLLIHPLIGIPCSFVVAAKLLETTRWKQSIPFLLIGGIPCGLLAAMAVYAISQQATLNLPSITHIQTSLVALFGTTYRFSADHIGLSLLYGFVSLWPFALCLIGIHEQQKTGGTWGKFRLHIAIGLCFAAVLLACFMRLPDIIAHEQLEFPLRLLHLVPLLFLPDIARLLERLLHKAFAPHSLRHLIVSVIVGTIAAIQWFMSYPQHNALAHTYAPSVSRYEYEALNWIEREAKSTPFIVLSHQMLAATALQTRGFEQNVTTCHGAHLRYAIPTGGALYQDFLRLLRSRNTPTELSRLKTCYGDLQIIMVVPSYWDPQQRIDQTLAPLSTRTHTFGNVLRVYVIK